MQPNIGAVVLLSILCAFICPCSPLQPQIQVLHPRPISVRLSRRVFVTGATSHEILSLNDTALLLFLFPA